MRTGKKIEFDINDRLPLSCNQCLIDRLMASHPDMTQKILSDRLGCSQSTVHRHLNAVSRMTISEAMDYARILNVDPFEFFGPLMTKYAGHFKKKKLLRAIEKAMQKRIYFAAAVCYQVEQGNVSFLLARSRSKGFWIFPRGQYCGNTSALALSTLAMQRLLNEGGVFGVPDGDEPFTTITRSNGASEQLFLIELLCDVMHRAQSGRKPQMFTLENAELTIRADFKRGRKRESIDQQITALRYAHEIIAQQRGFVTGRKKARQ